MEAREENFKKIKRTGEVKCSKQHHFRNILFLSFSAIHQVLISEGHFASSEVTSRLQTLDEEHKQLWDTWKKRQHLFQQSKELQVN